MTLPEKDKFRKYVEESHDLFYEVDTAGDIIYISPAIESLLGYSREYIMETDFKKYVHPEDRAAVAAKLLETIYSGEAKEIEVRLFHADGNIRIHIARGSLLYDEEGSTKSVIVISRDVTEHRKIEAELRESEKRYRNYVENAPHGVFVADENGRYLEVNPAAAAITGYTEDELLSTYIEELIHPEGKEKNRRKFLELTEKGYVKSEEPFLHKNGEKRWWTVTAVKISNNRFIGFTEDITERKEREQLKEDIARITQHDLKAPLNGILGAASLLLDYSENDPQAKDLADMIENAGKRMLNIINRSLSLYKIEKGTYSVQKTQLSCSTLIRTVIDDLSKSIPHNPDFFIVEPFTCDDSSERDRNLGGEEDCEDIYISGEYNLCYTLLTNLLTNAMEASEKNENVWISVHLKEKTVYIQIWNKASIPQEIRKTFGNKYVSSGKQGGIGLGAYSARLMVEIQGGSFTWKSSEEEGTHVTVALPVDR